MRTVRFGFGKRSDYELAKTADIIADIGQVVLAIAVLPPLITGLDKFNLIVLVFWLLVAILCWLFSIWIAGKRRRQ